MSKIIIPKYESENAEFKLSTSSLKEGILSLCAMINKTNKGYVYFGINDKGKIIGQTVSDGTIRDIEHSCYSNIEPKIKITITQQIIKGKIIVILYGEGNKVPYMSYGKYLIRQGTSDRPITPDLLTQLFQESPSGQWDQLMSDSTLKSIDQELFNNFVGRMREKQKEVFKDLSLKDAIIKLDLADNKKLKNAGKIIFSKDAKIPMSIASFVGIDKEGIKNTRKKSGNLYEILNACEEYLFNNTNYFTIMTGKVVGGRKEFPELPLTATREAIINSLVHRDYKSEESNSLYIYKDRIEIYNPGAFNTKFLPEDYIKGTARPLCRNNLIASTIYKVEDTENIGSGIKRIYDECKKMKIKVDFNKEKGGFSVVFWRKNNSNSTLTEISNANVSEKIIINYIYNNGSINRQQLISLLNISKSSAIRLFNKMVAKKIIKPQGGSKNIVYFLVENKK